MRMVVQAVLTGAVILGGGVGHRCFGVENLAVNVSGLTVRKTGKIWTTSFEVCRPHGVTGN